MTRLNHSRPYLRYIDNLRRELNLSARRTDTLSFGSSERKSERINTKYLLQLLDALVAYSSAQLETLSLLARGRTSKRNTFSIATAKQKQAEELLLNAATKVASIMVIEQMHGRIQMQKAYSDLAEKIRNEEESAWELLNNFAMSTALERVSSAIDSFSANKSM